MEVAPWIQDKLDLSMFGDPTRGALHTIASAPNSFLPQGCTLLAVHACGGATDLTMSIGLSLQSTAMFLLPCCHRPCGMSSKNKLYVERGGGGGGNGSGNGSGSSKGNTSKGKRRAWRRRRPKELEDRLGISLANDVDRTYILHEENYDVTWSVLPSEVTPMNRVMCCLKETVGGYDADKRTARSVAVVVGGGEGGEGGRVVEPMEPSLWDLWSKVGRAVVIAWLGTWWWCLLLPWRAWTWTWSGMTIRTDIAVVAAGGGDGDGDGDGGDAGGGGGGGGEGEQKEEEKVENLSSSSSLPSSSRRRRRRRKDRKARRSREVVVASTGSSSAAASLAEV